MQSTSAYLESLRPAGSKRSGKRDAIVDVFLQHEGHLSADDLVALMRTHDHRTSRATVYRTLQWMVGAGLARRVDFGDGRSRYERTYRHPRHFHLVCESCHRSFEFLSSDIESLFEEVAAARGFEPRQATLQIHGVCDTCRTGEQPVPDRDGITELVFARDALRVAIATEKSGLQFYTRAAKRTRDARGREVFLKLAAEEKHHLSTLEQRYRELVAMDPDLESRPTFLFFKGAANGLFAAGAQELLGKIDDLQALQIGIRCERGSHRFFKKYGERFEDSEGKRIFLEFADEEKQHLDLLINEYRSLVERQLRPTRGRRRTTPPDPPRRPPS